MTSFTNFAGYPALMNDCLMTLTSAFQLVKQTRAITGPHFAPHGNRYYITGIICMRIIHSDDEQTDRKCSDS